MFETGVERILKEYREHGSSSICHYFPPNLAASVPIVVVFTKLDILREHRERRLEKELEQRGEDIDDQEFDAKIEAVIEEDLMNLCVNPLRALMPSDCPKYPCIATSSGCALQPSLSKHKF
jgi:GTPase SAR1 family protein